MCMCVCGGRWRVGLGLARERFLGCIVVGGKNEVGDGGR